MGNVVAAAAAEAPVLPPVHGHGVVIGSYDPHGQGFSFRTGEGSSLSLLAKDSCGTELPNGRYVGSLYDSEQPQQGNDVLGIEVDRSHIDGPGKDGFVGLRLTSALRDNHALFHGTGLAAQFRLCVEVALFNDESQRVGFAEVELAYQIDLIAQEALLTQYTTAQACPGESFGAHCRKNYPLSNLPPIAQNIVPRNNLRRQRNTSTNPAKRLAKEAFPPANPPKILVKKPNHQKPPTLSPAQKQAASALAVRRAQSVTVEEADNEACFTQSTDDTQPCCFCIEIPEAATNKDQFKSDADGATTTDGTPIDRITHGQTLPEGCYSCTRGVVPETIVHTSSSSEEAVADASFAAIATRSEAIPQPTTALPTPSPTAPPTPNPTALPTPSPTAPPTPVPTTQPTPSPTAQPTPVPTAPPTPSPTASPTANSDSSSSDSSSSSNSDSDSDSGSDSASTSSDSESSSNSDSNSGSNSDSSSSASASTSSDSDSSSNSDSNSDSSSASTSSDSSASASSSDSEDSASVVDDSHCQGQDQQCGGISYSGETCCRSGYTCTYSNDWHSQCITNPASGGCSTKWEQCGGNNWKGNDCCIEGFTCHASSKWYSQCLDPND